MRTIVSKKFLLCAIGLTMAAACQASVIYSAPPDQSGGSDMNSFLEADNFTVTGPTQVQQIMFWSFQGSASDYAGSIAWSINNNSSGVPGSVVASGSATPAGVATGNSAFGLNEYSYLFSVSVPLTTGTYWLVLHNGPNNATPATDFFWGFSNGNAGNSQSQDLSSPGQPWTSNFAELAFNLQGTVPSPEPASMLLFGAGLLAIFSVRARKSN